MPAAPSIPEEFIRNLTISELENRSILLPKQILSLIIDEPQSVDGEKTLKSMQDFNPLFTLRYSATHKVEYNKVFRLDALDAYHNKLVKKIQVKRH